MKKKSRGRVDVIPVEQGGGGGGGGGGQVGGFDPRIEVIVKMQKVGGGGGVDVTQELKQFLKMK